MADTKEEKKKGQLGALFTCSLCGEEIPCIALLSHIPKCYLAICTAMGVKPFCTCPTCNATQSHPDVPAQPSKEIKSEVVSATAEPPLKRRRVEASQAEPNVPIQLPPLRELSSKQLTGKQCLVCPTKRKCKEIPAIHVGKYRTFVFCKKSHITDDDDSAKAQRLLEAELEIVRSSGDARISVIREGSPRKDKVEPSEEKKIELCAGYLDLDNCSKCSQETDGYLHIGEGNNKRSFCTPSHLLRYLLVHHCKQGKSAPRKKRGSTEGTG